tara:strand:- start:37 stop:324 length:288 start_codon:yes stop_codon:yes gene_type:complete
MSSRYVQAVDNLCGGRWFTIHGDDKYENITWTGAKKPTEAEVDAEVARLATLQYQDDRKAEYPDWGTQLDYIYHNGIDKWKTDIVDPVKAKYPKP